MARKLLCLAAALALAVTGAACGGDEEGGAAQAGADCITVPRTDGSFERVKEAGAIKIGAVDGLLPYSSSDPELKGFELEMADYVAEQLCVKAQPVFVSWAGLIPALEAKRFDAIFDGLFITPEREQQVLFTKPYYASGETIVVRKGNPEGIRDLPDLAGKTVGVLAGSVTVDAIKQVDADVTTYDDQNQILLEIGNGRIDAGYLEAPSSAFVLQKQPDLEAELVESYVPDETFNAGVAVRKGETDLQKALNLALDRLIESKQRDEIFKKYGVPYFPAK